MAATEAARANSRWPSRALLDGILEQAVIDIGLATCQGVSVALLVAVFVSNLPEVIGSACDMRASGYRPSPDHRALGRHRCGLRAGDGRLQAGVDGFAAGALLVMLVDQMIPEATSKGGNRAGLVTVLGFAVAARLSNLT